MDEKDPYRGAKLSLIMRLENTDHANVICEAAERGFSDVVRYLIEHEGVSPAQPKVFGDTPAMRAAYGGQLETLKILAPLSDLTAVNSSGMNALMIAAKDGHYECCELLASFGSKPKWNRDGWTPLMFAAQTGHARLVPLLAPLAPLGMRDIDGRDALLIAAKHNHIDFVKALFDLPKTPTLPSMERAFESAKHASFNEADPNECAKLLGAMLAARHEKEELRALSGASKKSSKPSMRI